jgi:hypothetical protein
MEVFIECLLRGSLRGGNRDRGELTNTCPADLDVAGGGVRQHGKRGTISFDRA